MNRKRRKTATYQVCKQEKALGDVLPGELVRVNVADEIRKDHPD